jgi:hypothetical protein
MQPHQFSRPVAGSVYFNIAGSSRNHWIKISRKLLRVSISKLRAQFSKRLIAQIGKSTYESACY